MIPDKILKWVFIVSWLVASTVATVQTLRLHAAKLDKAEAASALADERREAAVQLAAAESKVRKTESNLQASAAETREQIHEATQAIATERDALLVRVRNAEARAARAAMSSASTAAGNLQAPPGDPGGELLATIGREDVAEAERADLIRAALQGCYRDYEAARAALGQ